MKYVFVLEKRIANLVVVDADKYEQAEEKLKSKEWEWTSGDYTSSPDCCLGYDLLNFRKYTGKEEERVVCSVDELAECIGTTVDMLNCDVYKYKNCELSIRTDGLYVTIGNQVDGQDAVDTDMLMFPFSVKEFSDAVWRVANWANSK